MRAVRKTGVTAGDFDVEDLSTAFLRLDGGGTLLLESSWAQWIPHDQCYVTLYGSEGGASIEWGGGAASRTAARRLDRERRHAGRAAADRAADGHHRASVLQFLAKVRSGDFGNHRGEEALTRAR